MHCLKIIEYNSLSIGSTPIQDNPIIQKALLSYPDGTQEYYIDGVKMSKGEWVMNLECSIEEKVEIALGI